MSRTSLLLALALVVVVPVHAARPSPEALQLRDSALAALENEQPAQAQVGFEGLVAMLPREPLGHANLAIALLRQQQIEPARAALDRALALAPDRADLMALRAEIELWGGNAEAALTAAVAAASAVGDDPETWYTVLRVAQAATSPGADSATDRALGELARLRPENAVVLLSGLRRAIDRGDRTTATAALLRLVELSWQFPEAGRKTLGEVRSALEAGDLAAARVPAIRLENVTKILPLYQQSLRELSTGILGLPVWDFVDEEAPTHFGSAVPISFAARPLVPGGGGPLGGRLAWGFFDGDDLVDLVQLGPAGLDLRLAAQGWQPRPGPRFSGGKALLAADLDDDALLDVLVFGPKAALGARGDGQGGLANTTAAWGLGAVGAEAATVLDVDIEGDLDLAVVGAKGVGLWRNNLSSPLENVGPAMFGGQAATKVPRAMVATDLDRDGDPDLVLVDSDGLAWVENLRQGQLVLRRLARVAGARDVDSGDLDGDGRPELVVVGSGGVSVWSTSGRGGELTTVAETSRSWSADLVAVTLFDADNDGQLDLGAGGPRGVLVLRLSAGGLEPIAVEGGPRGAEDLVAVDLDADGDLDLVVSSDSGLVRLDNRGGNRNRWLAVRLRGIDRGNGKNNRFGLGATIEARSGTAYQWREVRGQVTHLGLGSQRAAQVLRVEWTNGVPQNRLDVVGRQVVTEEQVLKGSCPFLYTFDGAQMAFVTDLLWGAPIGLPYAPGRYVPADPSELVYVPTAVSHEGVYSFRVTEELWEAAFIDHVRLWLVDHPADVEVASALRMGVGPTPEEVRASRALRPLAGLRDHRGRDLTALVASRDEVYAHAFEQSRYQGVADGVWQLELDLGEPVSVPVRLHLDAWIFPADASLNLAVAQRRDLDTNPPRLEVEVAGEWVPVDVAFGFPAGKTKTMVVDLAMLPQGSSRLRLSSGMWLGFDRIVWTTQPVDDTPQLVAKLDPQAAELRWRGFSQLVRHAPNAPHSYNYNVVSATSPWLPFPGRYTRYGPVEELLRAADSRSVVMAAGDEIALEFDASAIASPPEGWVRSVFFETWGWDKDADRNTFEADQLEPLPFLEMEQYGDPLPEGLGDWQEEWLTRVVGPEGAGAGVGTGGLGD